MGEPITFFVAGTPKPGGSKRAFVIKGRAVLTDASGKAGKDWRGDVRNAAAMAYKGEPLNVPLSLSIVFHMPRPKAHFRANGELKPAAPRWHTHAPDTTKLIRSLEDALTGLIWRDDSIIVTQSAQKPYSNTPGAAVTVERTNT